MRSAHRTGAVSSLSRFFRPCLKLALIRDPAFPPCVCHASAFTARYLSPASMFFVIQIMLIVEIYSVRPVQDLFLRQLLCVCNSIFQCFLAALILSSLCLSPDLCRNVTLSPVYVFPLSFPSPHGCPAEFFNPFQILRTLKDVLFFHLLPVQRISDTIPDHPSIVVVP